MTDAFSKCHPAVNFLFFAGAIGACAVLRHPIYLAVSVFTGAAYYLLLNRRKGHTLLLGLIPLFLFLTGINPLFNTYGETQLFCVFGRPYTLEALYYGAALAAAFSAMLLWFGCYNKVLTGDKFTVLFGNLIPSVSLLLVMVLRMVPNLMRKAVQFSGARRSIGKGVGEDSSVKEKLYEGSAVLGTLTSWALEGGVITGDSMRARGYGAARRTGFMIYRVVTLDRILLILLPLLLALVIVGALLGQTSVVYTPQFFAAPCSWSLIPYTFYFLIPTLLHIKEAIQWHISRSGI